MDFIVIQQSLHRCIYIIPQEPNKLHLSMKFYFMERQIERYFHEMKLKCSLNSRFPFLCSTKFDIPPAKPVRLFCKETDRHPKVVFQFPAPSFGCGSSPINVQRKMRCKRSYSGTTSSLRGSCCLRRTNRQHEHTIHSLRSVCTFRDYFVAALLVPPQAAGRTNIREQRFVLWCTFRDSNPGPID